MKKMILSCLLLTACFAQADIKKIEADFNKCAANAVSTADSNTCSSVAAHDADLELNQVYNSIRDPLLKAKDSDSKEILNRLVKAERAWIAFRDADCDLEGTAMLGGTGEGVIIGGCLASKTIERVKFLQDYMPSK